MILVYLFGVLFTGVLIALTAGTVKRDRLVNVSRVAAINWADIVGPEDEALNEDDNQDDDEPVPSAPSAPRARPASPVVTPRPPSTPEQSASVQAGGFVVPVPDGVR